MPTTDSIDSIATPAYYAPQYAQGFPADTLADTAHVASMSQLPVVSVPGATEPVHHGTSPLHNGGVMGLMLLIIVLVLLSYRTGYKYIQNFIHNIVSVRRRENLFEDHTLNETRILTALIANTSVQEGILAYYAVGALNPSLLPSLQSNVLAHVGLLAVLALAFYLLQIVAYNLLGYIFADKVMTKLWLDGFKASQSLLGLMLLPVSCCVMLMPTVSNALLIVAAVLYFAARLAFICKGFRIFYSNLPSVVYFILYLCSVEIVPVILLYFSAIYLCKLI
ncbi:MAG: DUF4271 domain-containing protein [Muribaculaceae bacterium]|nr:DUF4271 domain-containing protein [Muribaculaceae bacterium]